MKVALGFLAGVILSGLLLLGMGVISAQGGESDNSTTSDNFTLTDLLPDIEKIYREALTTPLIEAEEKIWDEDIAEYYHLLLEKCSLTETENGQK